MARFDLNLIRVFSEIWTTRSLTLAAERLHVTQPAISAALSKLRAEFNDQLFVWNGKEMEPTDRAQSLIPEIREILYRSEALGKDKELDHVKIKRTFVIATVEYVMLLLGPKIINLIVSEYPDIKVSFTIFKPEMLSQASSAAIDLFIFLEGSVAADNMEHAHIIDEKYVLIAGKNNSSIPSSINSEQLKNLPKAIFTSSTLRGRIDSPESIAIDFNEHYLNHKILVQDYLLMGGLVAESDLIGLAPANMLKLPLGERLRILESPIELPEIHQGLYWHTSYQKDPAHKWLREKIIEIARDC